MSGHKVPRLLVVDDDLGVIAAYRHVLEGHDFSRAHALDELGDELFGPSGKTMLEDFSWRVHFADQGHDAVAAVQAAMANCDPFAVVFLDVRMSPGMDGYETAQQIRKIDPDVHVVFVSAYSDYSDEELSDAAGPFDKSSFMPKPVWPHELRATAIEHCLEAQRQAQMSIESCQSD